VELTASSHLAQGDASESLGGRHQ